MIKYKRISNNQQMTQYAFYPEGNIADEGIVAFYSNGKREVIKPSPVDVKSFYAGHALCGINLNKRQGTVAWY